MLFLYIYFLSIGMFVQNPHGFWYRNVPWRVPDPYCAAQQKWHVFSLQLSVLHFSLIRPWLNHCFEWRLLYFLSPPSPALVWAGARDKTRSVWVEGSGLWVCVTRGEFPFQPSALPPDAHDCYVMESCSNRVYSWLKNVSFFPYKHADVVSHLAFTIF